MTLRTTPFDPVELLTDEAKICEYLKAAAEERDSEFMREAEAVAARARARNAANAAAVVVSSVRCKFWPSHWSAQINMPSCGIGMTA